MLKPRYYQQDAFDAFFEYVENNHGKHPLIALPTGCVSWDTIINENRCTLGRKKRIDKIFKAFNGLNRNRKYNYDKTRKTFVRSFNGKTIQLNEVDFVTYSGVKELFHLILDNGKGIKATPDHKIMTKDGWKRMDKLSTDDYVMCDILRPKKSSEGSKVSRYKGDLFKCNLWFHPFASRVKTKKDKRGYSLRIEIHRFIYEAALNDLSVKEYAEIIRRDEEKSKNLLFVDPKIFDIHHVDGNPYNNDPSNLIKLKKREHRQLHSKTQKFNFGQGLPEYSKVKSISPHGKDHTYDIGCYKDHNFVANGIVVHNSGKSLVIAMIIKEILKSDHTRVLMLTHQKELIKQNYIELVDNFSDQLLDIGIYSAGLNCRDTKNRILFAGIQSVHGKAWELGWFDVILIDEAHRIPATKTGTYRKFFDDMFRINPNVVIAGLSATVYRMKTGMHCEGDEKIFDDVCHNTIIPELIDPNHFRNRDKKQYLCNIISKNGVTKADMSEVHVRGGEYVKGEMQQAYIEEGLVPASVKEIREYAPDRKKILVFTTGILHCEMVSEELNKQGLSARFIHSKMKKTEVEKNIQEFKDGLFNCLVNIDMVTTGFNEKGIDCVALLRSTKSPGLYYQIVGRGFRLHPDKTDCLVLDFGGNILFHGPVDKIEIRKNKTTGKSEVVTSPQKECVSCGNLMPLGAAVCPECGYEMPREITHDTVASDADILSKWQPPLEAEVENVVYARHKKAGKPDSMRVDYYTSPYTSYSEWICLNHGGFAREKALQWIKTRSAVPVNSVDEALEKFKAFRVPSKITIDMNAKFTTIKGYYFSSDPGDDPDSSLNMIDAMTLKNKAEEAKILSIEKKESSDDKLMRFFG